MSYLLLALRRARQACARLAQRVFLSIFLCLCLRIFLRRFLITEPNPAPRRVLTVEVTIARRPGDHTVRRSAYVPGLHSTRCTSPTPTKSFACTSAGSWR